jgi:hypothetical protein
MLRSVGDLAEREGAWQELELLASESRIDADIRVFVHEGPFQELLRRESASSAALFIGFRPYIDGPAFFAHFDAALKGLPPSFMVCAAETHDPTV